MLVEDNCNNLTLAKVAEIARMSYNPLVFQCKKHLGRSQRHLLFILRHRLGRQSKKYMLPTAPSVPRRSPIQVLTRLNAA